MPLAAPKPCTVCRALVRDGTSRCEQHKVVAWGKRPEVQRMTGRRLQAARAALFRERPFCYRCQCVVFPDTAVRDHIKPLAEGGADAPENTALMCHECHDAKSLAERLRARGVTPQGGVEKSSARGSETDLVPNVLRAQVSGV
ncbi:MAG: HNH endonuclease, partial [Burkholderiaceae bacterium]|nr:HNH endonuclease [Burkholderiaceae bacterium]